jgi:hypothetical protein
VLDAATVGEAAKHAARGDACPRRDEVWKEQVTMTSKDRTGGTEWQSLPVFGDEDYTTARPSSQRDVGVPLYAWSWEVAAVHGGCECRKGDGWTNQTTRAGLPRAAAMSFCNPTLAWPSSSAKRSPQNTRTFHDGRHTRTHRRLRPRDGRLLQRRAEGAAVPAGAHGGERQAGDGAQGAGPGARFGQSRSVL